MNEKRRADPRARRPSRRAAARARPGSVLLAGLALIALAGCWQTAGDFGRAGPEAAALAYTHHDQRPRIFDGERLEDARFAITGQPGAEILITDEEREMQNRVWRFISAPHARRWMFDRDVRPQLQNVRPLMDENFDPESYVLYLKGQDYRSSTVRYRTVANDIEADIDTLPATFEAICAAETIAERRRVAVAEIHPGGAPMTAELAAREGENDEFVDWFVRAVTVREQAYSLALDRLLIETPHEGAHLVNDGLNRLAPWTARAEARDFCPDADFGYGPDPNMGFGNGGRVLMGSGEEVLK